MTKLISFAATLFIAAATVARAQGQSYDPVPTALLIQCYHAADCTKLVALAATPNLFNAFIREHHKVDVAVLEAGIGAQSMDKTAKISTMQPTVMNVSDDPEHRLKGVVEAGLSFRLSRVHNGFDYTIERSRVVPGIVPGMPGTTHEGRSGQIGFAPGSVTAMQLVDSDDTVFAIAQPATPVPAN